MNKEAAGAFHRDNSSHPSSLSEEHTTAASAALLPRTVRLWVTAGVSALILAAVYLILVRGSAILFDLRDAVGAICF